MKVVIPVGALHVGGGCKVLAETANALWSRGHDTEIVIPRGMPVEYKINCKLTWVPALKKEYIPYGDIVLTNFYTTFLPSYQAWPDQCVRFSQGFEPYWVPDKEFAIWTYEQDVPIISVSHWLAEQIEIHTKRKSQVVTLGIEPTIFKPTVQNEWPKHKPAILLYIARDPQAGYMLKGFYDFVRAINYAWHHNKNFAVHMICPERKLMLPPSIPHHIYSAKTAKEMAEHYQTADLFISTSWFEGFGIPPLEAMACGTPVVTTNSGGVLDFSEHMKSAYIVEPKNPISIANGILSVLSNPALAQTLREGGLQSAAKLTQQNFEEAIVEALETIYEERKMKRG